MSREKRSLNDCLKKTLFKKNNNDNLLKQNNKDNKPL